MKNAAAYVRVSTEKQDEYSLDSQLKLIRQYAAVHDMIVPDEFVFVEDGISGRNAAKRKSFQQMIALAKEKSHPFEVILVWKFSRFARNQEESIFYKAALSRSGVDVVSISETLDDSPFSSLIERIIEWMDEFYSIRLSGEVKRGMNEKLSRAEVVTIPAFGYDIENKKYVPNANADTVRRIFSDYLSGKGLVTIARELGAEGVRTRRGSVPENRWVKYILENPVYIGKLRWSSGGKNNYTRAPANEKNAILVDGGHEPIIDAEVFEAVQKKLARKAKEMPYTRQSDGAVFMLKGLVRCSCCGSTLVFNSINDGNLQCHKYMRGKCRVSHSLSLRKANPALIEALENAVELGSFPLAPRAVPRPSNEPDYKHLIEVEEVKLKRVLAAYEAGVDTLEEYALKKARLLSGIEDLKQKQMLSEVSAAAAVIDPAEMRKRVVNVLGIIKSDSISESAKNEALRSILSHVVYEKAASRLALYFMF